MKRNKHITININEAEYNALVFIAEKQKRKLADVVYLLASESLNAATLAAVDEGGAFYKLKF